MPHLTYLNLGLGELAHTKLTVELVDRTEKYPKGIAGNVLARIGKFTFLVYFIILDMPEDVKVPLILRRPFLSTARAKIDFKRKNVTLMINRSLDPLNGDYIELNYLNKPFELRRNQGDDLMPTIEEGGVIEEFRTRDKDLVTGIDDYPILEDNEMGDIIFGEPFLREVGIKTKRFEGIDHIRGLNTTNEQCNKIPPILKVSEHDKMNGISHSYQKLKRFSKGVLNLGPDFIRVPSMEEWLTREHVSVHRD
ncbi:putative reverse transcriptase domain-containing protein [Tanacetum coccineum]